MILDFLEQAFMYLIFSNRSHCHDQAPLSAFGIPSWVHLQFAPRMGNGSALRTDKMVSFLRGIQFG
jgi:hypothetical protein